MKAQLIVNVQHAGQLPQFKAGMKGFAIKATSIGVTDKWFFVCGAGEILINRNEFAGDWDNSIAWCEQVAREYDRTGKLPDISNLEEYRAT